MQLASYVSVAIWTFDKQSNGRRIVVLTIEYYIYKLATQWSPVRILVGSGRDCVTTLGKLLTPMCLCLCHYAV